ncbi:hypothetical protein GW17_00024986 [Ensete ventricosum]|nr:hypothetical protein GW17_00024986 [Ensete ventricosum]RZS13324.1 hypothetical protein BHM03_00044882 [Ensete ventricosum]
MAVVTAAPAQVTAALAHGRSPLWAGAVPAGSTSMSNAPAGAVLASVASVSAAPTSGCSCERLPLQAAVLAAGGYPLPPSQGRLPTPVATLPPLAGGRCSSQPPCRGLAAVGRPCRWPGRG